MKQLDKEILIKKDLQNNIVRGVKVKIVPEVGMGVVCPSGSDSYGYTVLDVDPDRYTFRFGKKSSGVVYGEGILVTRKNSIRYGCYREAVTGKNGKLRPQPINRGVRCESFGDVCLTGDFEEPATYLDPSF